MNWELLKEALFPGTQGSFWATVAFWSLLALLAGLEFFNPHFQDHSHRDQRWPANFGLGLINMALLPLAPVSAVWAAEWAQSHKIGALNLLDGSWWLFAAIATVMIRSFSTYIIHFLLHKTPVLWRIHRVHHFDTAVDVSTGLRTHPLEFLLSLLLGIPIAIVFGLTPWALIAYEIADALFALFSHANIKFPARLDRVLRTVMVTPRTHAMHHSSLRAETDSNYGTVFTIWDRMFGTYCDPRAGRPGSMQFGLPELRDQRATDLWWQLKSPVVRLEEGPLRLPARSNSSRS